MTLTSTGHSALAAQAGELYWYSICGLPVQSAVRLPIPQLECSIDLEPAWVIRLGARDVRAPAEPATVSVKPPDSQDVPGTAFTTYLDTTGSWWWWESVATFHVSTDGRLIDVFPKSGAVERNLGLILTGPLASFVMFRIGHPKLHGSAVATPNGAVIFLGAAGYGKSTLAAAFVNRGMPLLADDLLPLSTRDDGIYVGP